MTITEALKIIQSAPADGIPFSVTLACGFTPLHLQTFLAARLQQAVPDRKVQVNSGLFGDLPGTLEDLGNSRVDGVAIALEWADLDARLDFRSAGSWDVGSASDVVATAQAILDRLTAALSQIPSGIRVAMLLPTLPLPPLFHNPGWMASEYDLLLRGEILNFATKFVQSGRGTVINQQALLEASPPGSSFDLKSYLQVGLPYTTQHADQVASRLSLALLPPSPKKGIITDLDDTLWSGIAGEIGPENVSWDLASHSQLHGLYQKLLASLAAGGTLIGIASKNDPNVVAQALARQDLLLRAKLLFPVEVTCRIQAMRDI